MRERSYQERVDEFSMKMIQKGLSLDIKLVSTIDEVLKKVLYIIYLYTIKIYDIHNKNL